MNYNYANSKPFSQVNKPFQFDQTFSIHGDNWNLRCVWFHGKSGFESKVWVLDLAIKREIQNGFHPHPPRNLSPNHDFMGVLYTVVVGKAWTMFFFFLLVMRARARQLFSQKQFISFLESSISAPPPPPPCLKKNINSKFKKFKKRKKGKPMTGLSALKSVFRFRVVRFEFQKSKSRFPNRIRRPFYLQKLVVSFHGNGCFWVFILWPIFYVKFFLAHSPIKPPIF